MASLLDFLKRTTVGGFFFLLPLAILVYLLGKAIRMMARIVGPFADALPFHRVVGIAVADIVGAAAILLVCFLAGLLARTGLGTRLVDGAENLILKKVPGYTLLRSLTREGTLGTGTRFESALARVEDAWVLAFIVERHDDGLLTVFVPSSPTPAAGTIYYLTPDRVRRLDVPVTTTAKLVMQLGVGSAAALRGKFDSNLPR